MEPGADMQIWRVNMRTRTFQREDVPDSWEKTGGRGLSLASCWMRLTPAANRSDQGNKLVFALACWLGTCYPARIASQSREEPAHGWY